MPEFVLNTAGHVGGQERRANDGSWAIKPFNMKWQDLDAFTQGYIEALFFTNESDPRLTSEEYEEAMNAARDKDDYDGAPSGLPSDCGFADLAPEALAKIIADCQAFQATLDWQAFAADRNDNSANDAQAGRDFWFTRNGHGVGFWDRPASFYGPHQVALDTAAREDFREVDAYLGDDGNIYLS